MALYDAMFEMMDDAQLIGTSTTDYNAATAIEIDWGAAGLEMGAGEPLYFNLRVGTTAYSPTTADDLVTFILTADDTSSGHDSSSDVVLSSGPRQASTLTAGAWILRVPLPVNVDSKRYLQLGATFNEATVAGTVNCWIDNGSPSSYDTQVSASNI
jgi:hypothetical protein